MKKEYIDLHIHSIYSDGDRTPLEILKMAEELKLKYIAITDHENCKAYEALTKINVANIYHGNIIRGCELMTSFDDVIIEILGYNVDVKIINDWYDEEYAKEKIRNRDQQLFQRLVRRIQIANLKLEKEICLPVEIPYSGYFKYMTYKELKKDSKNNQYFKEYDINNYEEFIRKGLSNPQNPLFIKEADYIATIQETVNLIHKAGGLAFIAHLYKYKIENPMVFLKNIIKVVEGIDGVECYYPSFTKEQTRELEEFCDKNKLFKSGGSDYHGKLKPYINIGQGTENTKIEAKVIDRWIK